MSLETHYECEQFLVREAEALDDSRYEDWLSMLADDIEYVAPLRQTKENIEEAFETDAYYYREDKKSLRVRIERFQTGFAWIKTPPPRTRRFVSNVRIEDERGDEVDVKSNLLLRITERDDWDASSVITCERHDVLRRTDDSLELTERTIYLDETALDRTLSFFF